MHDSNWFLNELRGAGMGAYLSLFVATVSSVAGVLAIALRREGKTLLATLALGGAVLTLLIGFAAKASGRSVVEQVLPHVDPQDRERVREQGFREADGNVTLAALFAIAPGLLGACGLVLAQQKR